MDTFKRILKGVVGGFVALVIIVIVTAAMSSEETVTPEITEEPSLGTYTIDGDDELFDGYTMQTVQIWASEVNNTLSDNRELITGLERGTEVELLQRGSDNWYCKVRHGSDVGWLACGWLR